MEDTRSILRQQVAQVALALAFSLMLIQIHSPVHYHTSGIGCSIWFSPIHESSSSIHCTPNFRTAGKGFITEVTLLSLHPESQDCSTWMLVQCCGGNFPFCEPWYMVSSPSSWSMELCSNGEDILATMYYFITKKVYLRWLLRIPTWHNQLLRCGVVMCKKPLPHSCLA
jgi:hypothetical protein